MSTVDPNGTRVWEWGSEGLVSDEVETEWSQGPTWGTDEGSSKFEGLYYPEIEYMKGPRVRGEVSRVWTQSTEVVGTWGRVPEGKDV